MTHPERIVRDTLVLVPAAGLAGGLLGGPLLAVGALAVGGVVLLNLWAWTRLSTAWLASAASEEGDPIVAMAMAFKTLVTVPLFIGLTYLFGAAAVGLGLGVPLVGMTLRLVWLGLTTPTHLPTPGEEVSP